MATHDPSLNLFTHIRKIFNRDWDPIGVFKISPDWPGDEYDRYAGHIAVILEAGSSDEEILAYLEESESVTIGLPGATDKRCLQANVQEIRALMPSGRT